MPAVPSAAGGRRRPWAGAALAGLLLPEARGEVCGESPVNWTAVREDLVTYSTLSEPRHRSRRCFGLDAGIWSYCGISAMSLLQMVPGLVSGISGPWALPQHAWNPCPLGSVAVSLFALAFLTKEERYGMLFAAAQKLEDLDLSFQEMLTSGWPIFGLLAKLSEEVLLSGGARLADLHGPGDSRAWSRLRGQAAAHAAGRGPLPEELLWRLQRELESVDVAESTAESGGTASNGLHFARSTLWAARAELAAARGEAASAGGLARDAEASLRRARSNYTHLDWLSSRWPFFRILHRAQFLLAEPGFVGPPPDLVPYDAETGRPLKFAFNKDFIRHDTLNIDVASDIIRTDLLRSLPAFFGMDAALPRERWNLNYVYTSNDYADLLPTGALHRLRARSQRLVYVLHGPEVIGEKDKQCSMYHESLSQWNVKTDFEKEVGGVPLCFEIPKDQEKLAALERAAAAHAEGERRAAFVFKPEGAWGGRGIEIRFGVSHFLAGGAGAKDACTFEPLENVQCLGLSHAASDQASASEAACRSECCEEISRGHECDAWNWRDGDGCWLGVPRGCSAPSAALLGGWRGGRRARESMQEGSAVVQQYILDPVVYQLEGISPPLRVKTDIRIYGTAISLDPLRLYVSRHGYFRSGYLERNFSTATPEDLADRLMHITHHIPKIEAGSYQCPTAPSWGDPEDAERGAGSGGSLHKWFRIAREQNGLDPRGVWRNIKATLGLFVLAARSHLSCRANPERHACGSMGFQFFADLVVDSRGRAWLMEVHPTLALKSHGLGDPEGGWVEVLTRHTRQGAMGTLATTFIGRSNAPFGGWAERVVRRRLLNQGRWRGSSALVRRQHRRERAGGPGWGGEAASLAELLARLLTEEHMACRLAVAPVLPAGWRRLAGFARAGRAGGDPFAGLRPLYRLLEAARWLVRRRAARGAGAPGDLRPEPCVAVDFNAGSVWDQPWERASRRFQA